MVWLSRVTRFFHRQIIYIHPCLLLFIVSVLRYAFRVFTQNLFSAVMCLSRQVNILISMHAQTMQIYFLDTCTHYLFDIVCGFPACMNIKVKEEGKDQELIQSSSTPDPGHYMTKTQEISRTREPRG